MENAAGKLVAYALPVDAAQRCAAEEQARDGGRGTETDARRREDAAANNARSEARGSDDAGTCVLNHDGRYATAGRRVRHPGPQGDEVDGSAADDHRSLSAERHRMAAERIAAVRLRVLARNAAKGASAAEARLPRRNNEYADTGGSGSALREGPMALTLMGHGEQPTPPPEHAAPSCAASEMDDGGAASGAKRRRLRGKGPAARGTLSHRGGAQLLRADVVRGVATEVAQDPEEPAAVGCGGTYGEANGGAGRTHDGE
jgi:hypothetical protein